MRAHVAELRIVTIRFRSIPTLHFVPTCNFQRTRDRSSDGSLFLGFIFFIFTFVVVTCLWTVVREFLNITEFLFRFAIVLSSILACQISFEVFDAKLSNDVLTGTG